MNNICIMTLFITRARLRSLVYLIALCFSLPSVPLEAAAQPSSDRSILLARQFAECSGAYYASSEAVTILNGSSKKAVAFKEKGNGFLLAGARILTSTKPKDGFDAAYRRVEERANSVKSSWLTHISDVGDAGVEQINRVTESCTQQLGKERDTVLEHIRKETQNKPRR